MSDRRCPTCNTWKDEDLFRVLDGRRLARDCIPCEVARLRRASIRVAPVKTPSVQRRSSLERNNPGLKNRRIEANREFPGIDIDAIYDNPRYRHLRKASG